MPSLQEQLAALTRSQEESGELGTLQRVAKLVDAPDASAQARLEDLGVDSLGLIALVVRIEQEFGVRASAEQALAWESLEMVARDVEKLEELVKLKEQQ